MALRNPPFVKVASATSGIGTYTYTETPTAGYRTFTDALADGDFVNGDTVYLMVTDPTALGSARLFEFGLYTVNTTAKTIARTTVIQSSDGVATAANWGAGTRDIYVATVQVVLAILAAANKFTSDQEIEKSAAAFILDALSSDPTLLFQLSGTLRARVGMSSSSPVMYVDYLSSGSVVQGRLIIGNGVLQFATTAAASGDEVDRYASGTALPFFNAAAPARYTKQTSQNDKALRVVSGTGGGAGGSRVLSAATTGAHTLLASQIPSHTHGVPFVDGEITYSAGANESPFWLYVDTPPSVTVTTDAGTGGGGSHDHALALAYIDVIVCTKN
jgi:hypothetical protein